MTSPLNSTEHVNFEIGIQFMVGHIDSLLYLLPFACSLQLAFIYCLLAFIYCCLLAARVRGPVLDMVPSSSEILLARCVNVFVEDLFMSFGFV